MLGVALGASLSFDFVGGVEAVALLSFDFVTGVRAVGGSSVAVFRGAESAAGRVESAAGSFGFSAPGTPTVPVARG